MKQALLSAVIGMMLASCSSTQVEKSVAPGKVVVLNGPSGAGKSSIQRELQKLAMPNLWVKTGIDSLFDQPMPDITPENMAVWQAPNPIRWVESHEDEEGKPVITLKLGEQGLRVAHAMSGAIAAYAKSGCNVIVDFIAYDPSWIDHLESALNGVPVYWVAVKIPLETLEKREAARGTSPVGHGRSHYHTVYGEKEYGMEVNSEHFSAEEIAQQILNWVEKQ